MARWDATDLHEEAEQSRIVIVDEALEAENGAQLFEQNVMGALTWLYQEDRPKFEGEYREKLKAKLKGHGGISAYEKDNLRRGAVSNEQIDESPFTDPEPWTEHVSTTELLEDTEQAIRRFVFLADENALTAITLWIVHTHVFEAGHITPRLLIVSPLPECGKSTLLDVIEHTARRSFSTGDLSAASMFRLIEKFKPSILIDEGDTFLKDNDAMRNVINQGHKFNGKVIRVDQETNEVCFYSCFAPCVICMIDEGSKRILFPATISRSLIMRMERMPDGEERDEAVIENLATLKVIQSKARRWAVDHFEEFKHYTPAFPDGIHGRRRDNWRLLLAIAENAGPQWTKRAHKAIRAFCRRELDDEHIGVLLLEDLRELFMGQEQKTKEHHFTEAILKYLNSLGERPWPTWGRRDNGLTPRHLSDLLRPYGVRPRTIRDESKTAKGYVATSFVPVWKRYLPPTPSDDPSQRHNNEETSAESESDTSQAEPGVTDRKSSSPYEKRDCDVVTNQKGDNGQGEIKNCPCGERAIWRPQGSVRWRCVACEPTDSRLGPLEFAEIDEGGIRPC